jgi:integrase
MPRKPQHKIVKTTVVITGTTIAVTLYPPKPPRTSWYAYWPGLITSKSTGQASSDEALRAVVNMLQNGGKLDHVDDLVLNDEEFKEIQQRHYGKKRDPDAMRRAEGSLTACLEAITAFKEITGLTSIAAAKPADCERFQHAALALPKNWRSQYPRSKTEVAPLSPSTAYKWSVALQAAFERANRNAPGRKCVRGVVSDGKLLSANPWHQFTWIEGRKRKIRQFNGDELIAFLDFLETHWPGFTVAPLVAKVLLWSWGRKREIMGLRWEDLRAVGNEYHFESVGKWGVDKWFRIPEAVYRELLGIRTDSPYVFGAYNSQLREFFLKDGQIRFANKVRREFSPDNLGSWFYQRVATWSASLPQGAASIHVFRKTTLQYARSGEDLNRLVAADARVSENVMMTNYVKETDEEMRAKSNRTFWRIVASVAPKVAQRYGFSEEPKDPLQVKLEAALAVQNWDLAARLAAELAKRDRTAG